MRRLRVPAIALLLLATAGFRSFRHEVHVSSGRTLIEERVAYSRVRLFRDDFEAALRRATGNPEFFLVVTPAADAAVAAYASSRLSLGGWKLTIVGSGEEKGLKPELDIWWLDLRFDAAAAPGEVLEVRNELLFELFRDQTNVMKFRLPDGSDKTVTFVPGEGTYRLKL